MTTVSGVRLEDADYYLLDPAETWDRLRESDPVHYYEPLDTYVITKYDDVRMIGRAPHTFSVNGGILLNDFRYGEVLRSFFPPAAEIFSLEDPPRHNELRRLMMPAFSPKRIAEMEETVRRICAERLEEIEPGQPVNWSATMAEPLTLIVISLLLGIPLEDTALVKEWSDIVMTMGACTTGEELAVLAGSLAPMGAYFEAKLADRAKEPRDDLITAMQANRDDGIINNATVHMMLSGVMTAGNETTRNAISGAMEALAAFPAQMRKLAAGEVNVKNAVEEILRWVTPVRGFGRTAVHDTEIRGTAIGAGQRVYMVYMGANRDPEAFENPGVLDLNRTMSRPQLGFGFGQHACIGAPVARLELRVLFEELSKRFSAVEVVSQERVSSTLANGYANVIVRFGT